jgi:hypothetical protein
MRLCWSCACVRLAACDLGGAFDHHPVLGTMMVHLQRERGAGAHHDALDLEAFAVVDAVIPAPGPMHLAMQVGFARPAALSRPTMVLTSWVRCLGATSTASAVSTTTMSSQPMQATRRCSAMTRLPVESSVQTSPLTALSSPSWRNGLPQGIPGADVGPAGGERDDLGRDAQFRGGRQLLHHGVVDRIGRAGGKGIAHRGGQSHRRRGRHPRHSDRRRAWQGRNGRWP